MPDPFATPDDLAARWRPLGPAEETRAKALLSDASVKIRARFRDVDARIQSGVLDAELATMVACAMVRRAMQPGIDVAAVTQQSESFAGFNRAQTFANPQGDLYLAGDDIKALSTGQRAGTIDPWG